MKNKKNLLIITFIIIFVSAIAVLMLNQKSYAITDTEQSLNHRTADTTYGNFSDVSNGTIEYKYSSSVVFKSFSGTRGSTDFNDAVKVLEKSSGTVDSWGTGEETGSEDWDNIDLRYKLYNTGDYLTVRLKNSAVDTQGNLMDVVIKVKVTGMVSSDDDAYGQFSIFNKYKLIDNSKTQKGFVPEDQERSRDVVKNIQKGSPILFGLGARSAHISYTMTYYKGGTINTASDLTDTNKAQNIRAINSFFYDLDVPRESHPARPDMEFLDGDEGFVPLNGKSKIYYNAGNIHPTGASNYVTLTPRDNGISSSVHAGYTLSGGNDTNAIWYQSSAFMTTDEVDNSLNFLYGGTGCGIMFGFFSPYKYDLPAPVKSVVDKKEYYYTGESFTYRVSQYVPNNYFGQDLGFHGDDSNPLFSNIPKTTRYTSFVLKDSIEKYLTVNQNGITIKNDIGQDFTTSFDISVVPDPSNSEKTLVTATAKSAALDNSAFYAHTINLDIPVTIKKSGVNVATIPNIATRQFDVDPEPVPTNPVDIDIVYKLIVKHLEKGTNIVLDDSTGENRDTLKSGDVYNDSHISERAKQTHKYVETVVEPEGTIKNDANEPTITITDHDVTITYYYARANANLYKTDSTDKTIDVVPGAILEVYDSDNKMVAKWTTKENVKYCNLAEVQNTEGCEVTEVLKPNSTYTVKETKTPSGYATGSDLVFKTGAAGFPVDEKGEYTNGIEFKNDPIKICIISVDMNDTPIPGMVTEITKMDGTRFEMIDKRNGNKLNPFTSVSDYTCRKYVPVDDYNIDEIEVVGDYIKEGIKKITVKDTPEVQNFIIYNSLKVPKTNLNNTKLLAIIATVFAAFGLGAFAFVKYRNKKTN